MPIKSAQKYRLRIVKSKAKQPYHVRILANNQQIIWTSEKYSRKENAVNVAKQFVFRCRPGIAVIEFNPLTKDGTIEL